MHTELFLNSHYNDIIMGATASQITSVTIVYPTVYSGADQRRHQSSASLVFVREIHRRSVNSPQKWPVILNNQNNIIAKLLIYVHSNSLNHTRELTRKPKFNRWYGIVIRFVEWCQWKVNRKIIWKLPEIFKAEHNASRIVSWQNWIFIVFNTIMIDNGAEEDFIYDKR